MTDYNRLATLLSEPRLTRPPYLGEMLNLLSQARIRSLALAGAVAEIEAAR